jgi:CoA:oxalate CoA-transferase
MAETCLAHLKVLELCSLVAGPYCTKLLADLGAEVTKIEPPGTGDQARSRGPFLNDSPDGECSGLFLYLNTNKLGITLDVKTETGRAILRRLVEEADVLVEDNPPAVMRELGLTYGDLREINPRLIVTSITPFGQTGPYRDYKGGELNVVHAGGEGYMMPIESTYPDREPVKGGGLVGDCVCGLSGSLATLAAAYRMRATGLGQHIDVSKQDVLMTLVGLEVAYFAYSGVVRNRHYRSALMATPMKCRDGYIMISAFADHEWQKLARVMGKPEWAEDERYSHIMSRWQCAEEINPGVEEWTQQHSKDEIFHQLQAAGVAAAPVSTPEDLVRSPQLRARGFFTEIDHARAGALEYPTLPFKLSETPHMVERAAPLLGEHNNLVYCGRLGFDGEDVAKLAEAGVI